MGDNDFDQTRGPGWRDWLTDADRKIWTGERGLKLDESAHRKARRPWHGVLCDRIGMHNGLTEQEMVECLDWFYLRLTRKEIVDLRKSASRNGLITREEADGDDPREDSDRRWILTDKGEKYHAPRGAGVRDLGKRIIPSLGQFDGVRKAVTSILGVVSLAFGIGALAKGGLMPELVGIAAMLMFAGLVLLGALVDERGLRAMALAWPRVETYRPGAYRFVTFWLPTPGPVTALACLFVLAGVGVCWRLAEHDKLSATWWPGFVLMAAAIASFLIFMFHQLYATAQTDLLRAGYDKERKSLRQEEFKDADALEVIRARTCA